MDDLAAYYAKRAAELDVAASKNLPKDKVVFGIGNAYAPPDLGRRHDALFAGFWWSHVLLRRAAAHGTEAKVESFKYFWLLSWRTPK